MNSVISPIANPHRCRHCGHRCHSHHSRRRRRGCHRLPPAVTVGRRCRRSRCRLRRELVIKVATVVELTVARHGHLDVIVNNIDVVGSLAQRTLGLLDLTDFDIIMAINTRGVLAWVKHAASVMVPCRSGVQRL
uniref:Uncharacterized protein n=1 Tax=Oryza brachyantha TaxID=4533 RepID=J3N7Z3_ORYBR